MAPSNFYRAARLPLSAVALATLTFGQSAAIAQTVYREYDDGRIETFSRPNGRDGYAAPLRRPPRDFEDDHDDDDDDERFERDDPRRENDDLDDSQGQLDFAPDPARKPPAPPPSVNAKPDGKAWKPDL